MPKSDSERLSTIETKMNTLLKQSQPPAQGKDKPWHQWQFWLAALGQVIVIGIFVSNKISALDNRIGTIETALAKVQTQLIDHGYPKVGDQLNSSKSPQESQASLSTITAQLQTARLDHVSLAPERIHSISTTLAGVVTKDPNTPGVWQAASALVNLKQVSTTSSIPPEVAKLAGSATPNKGDCFTKMPHASAKPGFNPMFPAKPGDLDLAGPVPPSMQPFVEGVVTAVLHDCDFTIDDVEGFRESPGYKAMTEHHPGVGSISAQFILVRVRIIYRGRPLVPVYGIQCFDCTYDFDLPSIPPANGQLLIRTLLAHDGGEGSYSVLFG